MKRREYLRAKHEQEEYDQMVGNIDVSAVQTEADRYKRINRDAYKSAVSVSINVISLVFALFFVGYYLATATGYSTTVGLICGLFLGVMMLIVELLLFIIRDSRNHQNPTNQKFQDSSPQKH